MRQYDRAFALPYCWYDSCVTKGELHSRANWYDEPFKTHSPEPVLIESLVHLHLVDTHSSLVPQRLLPSQSACTATCNSIENMEMCLIEWASDSGIWSLNKGLEEQHLNFEHMKDYYNSKGRENTIVLQNYTTSLWNAFYNMILCFGLNITSTTVVWIAT